MVGDQDSLDGQMPSSSRSLVHDNPSGITPSPVDPPPAPPPMNFTKGPGASKKRHRKLNPETEDTMSEDDSNEPSLPPAPTSKEKYVYLLGLIHENVDSMDLHRQRSKTGFLLT